MVVPGTLSVSESARQTEPVAAALFGHFRGLEQSVNLGLAGELSRSAGFFRFGPAATCFGRCAAATPIAQWAQPLPDASRGVRCEKDRILLPFDVSEVASNLRLERYRPAPSQNEDLAKKIYYFFRPVLGIPVRKHLQRIRLRGWKEIPFPHWPVDFSVEDLFEQVLLVALKETGVREIPFIWFWPDGAPSALLMTHDVEGPAGLGFCEQLMTLDDSFGIKSAFQLVPEKRYADVRCVLDRFWLRGFEVNVHDVNHDGSLFNERQEFIRRAKRINEYAKEFGMRGFRSGGMYRRQEWYDAFDLSYDMSVPNMAHLEPQRGGCCTTMPYFIGKVLEIPLTTVEDYSLFHIVGDYSIDLWKRQMEMISQRHGLISFVVHPDYIVERKAQQVYLDLLTHIAAVRDSSKVWCALPGEIDRWWRSRDEMTLIQSDGAWRIEGPQHERARVAFASVQGDRLVYRFQ